MNLFASLLKRCKAWFAVQIQRETDPYHVIVNRLGWLLAGMAIGAISVRLGILPD